MKDFFVYIIRCADGSFYIGHTDDIDKRMAEHKSQKYQCYTKLRLPVELVFCSAFASRDEAIVAERKIKGWSRAKKQALIDKNFELLHELSARRHK